MVWALLGVDESVCWMSVNHEVLSTSCERQAESQTAMDVQRSSSRAIKNCDCIGCVNKEERPARTSKPLEQRH